MPDPDWWKALWPHPAEVITKLGVQPTWYVIDLCCGDGLFTLPLAKIARQVMAIDIDPVMLRKAQARLAQAGLMNCNFVEADAGSIQEIAQPQSADLVLIANTFHGVPDKVSLVRTVAAVLRPRGRFVVINWHHRPREETTVLGQPRGPKTEMRMEPADVVGAVQPVGLTLAGVIELPPYHYAAMFERPTEAAA
jgi:ubiquinone/menaquinone biosynthesis C-methylase UbiE